MGWMTKSAVAVVLGLTAFARGDGPTTKPATIEITLDTTAAPEMADFAAKCKVEGEKYYPTIAELLPSDGYTPADKVTLTFLPVKEGQKHYVAYTSSKGIFCDPDYYSKHPKDVGSVIHELAHVVQRYRGRQPGWLTEGIADWVRWFHYEPENKRPHPKGEKPKYDDAYQTTAAFLFWASDKYNPKLVEKLNDACRQAHYKDSLWKDLTGKTVQELGDEWKATLPK